MGLVPDPLAHHLERIVDYYERIGVDTLDQLLQSRQLSKGARGLSSSSLSV